MEAFDLASRLRVEGVAAQLLYAERCEELFGAVAGAGGEVVNTRPLSVSDAAGAPQAATVALNGRGFCRRCGSLAIEHEAVAQAGDFSIVTAVSGFDSPSPYRLSGSASCVICLARRLPGRLDGRSFSGCFAARGAAASPAAAARRARPSVEKSIVGCSADRPGRCVFDTATCGHPLA